MRYCTTTHGAHQSQSYCISVTETWNRHVDQGRVIGAILIDFCKAFDSVCPEIFSCKLQAWGIGGNLLQWLNSFLSHRHWFVELNGVKSPVLEVKYGVPQWQDLYKRRLAVNVFKVKQGFNHRLLSFFTFTESKRKVVLLEVKRQKTARAWKK